MLEVREKMPVITLGVWKKQFEEIMVHQNYCDGKH
jgi:hypothetical protein